MRPWTWDGLAAETLRRQFPGVRGHGPAAVVEMVRRVGPVQSQSARATFLAVSARLPGATREAVSVAHASGELVRSTSLRGTVHTSARDQHPALEGVATRSLAGLWRRTLKLDELGLAEFWDALEGATEGGWCSPGALESVMADWLASRRLRAPAVAVRTEAGRTAYRSHAAMLRRPAGGAWEGQGGLELRASRYVLGGRAADPQRALVELVRWHLAASGPATRRDLAWWSGEGLRNVDAAVAAIRDELEARPGPGGLEFLDLADLADLADLPSGGVGDPGVRLLPEFDALLLGYDAKARDRFVGAEVAAHIWNRANGMHSATVLVDGRLRGRWRLERRADTAAISVEMPPGERLLDTGELGPQAAAVGAVLGLTVADVSVSRWRD